MRWAFIFGLASSAYQRKPSAKANQKSSVFYASHLLSQGFTRWAYVFASQAIVGLILNAIRITF